jgi:hypothetical protein
MPLKDANQNNRTESAGHRHAAWPAASRINCEITSGCDIRDRWLAFTSFCPRSRPRRSPRQRQVRGPRHTPARILSNARQRR